MAKTYTVKWGDTLSEIAAANNTSVSALAKLNNIANVDYIVVGQVIKLEDDKTTPAKVTNTQAKITSFGLVSGTTNQVRVTWSWDRQNTKEYSVKWEEYSDGRWFEHNSTTTYKYSDFTPSYGNSTKVRVSIKPVSTTYTNTSGKEVKHWTNVSWTSKKTYSFSNNPPLKPSSTPSISIENDKLTASLGSIGSLNASIVEFDVYKDGKSSYKKKKVSTSNVSNDTLSVEFTIDIGSVYKVRARSIKSDMTSAWSNISEEKSTVPSAPTIKKCMEGSDEESVDVEWTPVTTATSYTIQACSSSAFPIGNSDHEIKSYGPFVSTSNEFKNCYAKIKDDYIKNLAKSNSNIYVRMYATNDKLDGNVRDSAYSEVAQTNIGNGPAAPTTSSSRTIYTVGDLVTLQWTHNPANNTSTGSGEGNSIINTENYAKYSHVDLYVNGTKKLIPTLVHFDGDTPSTANEKSHEKTFTILTKSESDGASENDLDIVCPDGATLTWRVRTAGKGGELGEWSVIRTIEVYAEPTLTLRDASDEEIENESTIDLSKLPIIVRGDVEPDTQYIIGYHVEITANTNHYIPDNYGETVSVREGDVVFARSFDDITGNGHEFEINLGAGDVTLAKDANYTLTCTVTMNSGKSVAKSFNFNVLWESTEYYIDADVEIDRDNLTATIHPYCKKVSDDTIATDVLLYVYRREYDGTFTRISGDLDNTVGIHVIDPHPALDYARYRIVAQANNGSTCLYTDINDYPVNEKALVLQWDENYSDFTVNAETDEVEGVEWGGQMLKLPYNLSVSSKYNADVSLIEYIGREHPVSYYGTQLGEGETLTVDIPKKDTETLYKLRRLARWMGDVYVREPSGTGYWANISLSFNQKNLSLTIPVTINVMRVEGGK